MNHIDLGNAGEDLAVEHLTKSGFRILERNFRWQKGEVDILCLKDGLLIAVEVKTRRSTIWGAPYLAVTKTKQKQIIGVTDAFLRLRKLDLEVRFDVLSIIVNPSHQHIEHIEGAFLPRW